MQLKDYMGVVIGMAIGKRYHEALELWVDAEKNETFIQGIYERFHDDLHAVKR